MSEYYTSTIGLLAKRDNSRNAQMVRAEVLRTEEGYTLKAVNAETLGYLRVPDVKLAPSEWIERPFDHCNDIVEAAWALDLLGFEVAQ